MAIRQATLVVWANPYLVLDHLGRPAGACSRERLPMHVNSHPGYIGCECVASAPEKLPPGHAGTPDQDTCWHFSRQPVTVPDNPYYRQKLRYGEVFPADEKTARTCGMKFVPLDEAVSAAKAAAVARWESYFGEKPEDVDPYARPKPAGKESPADAAARGALERSGQLNAAKQPASAVPAKPAKAQEG